MAQSPEELRQEIELRAQIRRQREHHRAQAARNLMGKSFLRDGHTRFKDRDAAIRDGIDQNSVRHKIARSVSKDQVPLQASANDLLELTFGRDKRGITDQLTPDDIRQFERNIAVAAENFQGGITPQQVIDWSRQIDRDRAVIVWDLDDLVLRVDLRQAGRIVGRAERDHVGHRQRWSIALHVLLGARLLGPALLARESIGRWCHV